MPFDVFISHSSADKKIAETICAGLEQAGLQCWIAPRNVTGGLDYADQISEAIQECPATLLVFSGHSNESRHVKAEIDAAFGNGKILLPLRIEAVQPTKGMAHYLRNTHWLDALGTPTNQDIAHVAATLKSLLAGAPAPATPKAAPVSSPSPHKPNLMPLVIGGAILALGAGTYFLVPKSKVEPAASSTASSPAQPGAAEAEETDESEVSPEQQELAGAFADAYLAMGNMDEAAEQAAEAGWDPKRAEAMARAYLIEGHLDKALDVLAGGGTPGKTERYKALILEAKEGVAKQTFETLQEIEKTGGQLAEFAADARIFILLAAAKGAKIWTMPSEDFERLLAEAEKLTAEDTWENNAREMRIAKALVLAKQTDKGLAATSEMEQALTEPITDESAPVAVAVMEVYLAVGDLEGARKFYDGLKFESNPDEVLLPLVSALLENEQVEEAATLAFSGPHPRSQEQVIETYLSLDDFDKAIAAAENPVAEGLAPTALTAAAYEENEGGADPQKAEVWRAKLRSLSDKAPSKVEGAKILAEAARIQADAGFFTAAEKTMEEAEAKAK